MMHKHCMEPDMFHRIASDRTAAVSIRSHTVAGDVNAEDRRKEEKE